MLILALTATACREGTEPFTIANPFEGDETGQLTFNPKNDHTPFWNEVGDSVYYVAESFPSFPSTRGLLLAVPRTGGTARTILPAVQQGIRVQPWLSAPVPSPDGNSIAFFELTDVRDAEFDQVVCPGPPTPPGGAYDTLGTGSILQQAVLRVRPVSSTSPSDVGSITIAFAGRTAGPVAGAVINVAHPFQRLFEAEGVPIFRASWSPDGTRLVFSDGTQLRIWTVGQAASVPLPGTNDGILPAWSPDGSWIAFSKPFRGTTQSFVCQGLINGQVLPAAIFDRTVYTPLTREDAQLMVVRPDGTGLRSIGEGDGPAWTPDSRTIVAHRERNLYRIELDTGAAAQIPNTLNGYEPAISGDGRFLAFARRVEIGVGEGEPNSRGNYNIWVVSF